VLAEGPKAAVTPYFREGLAPPNTADEMVSTTYLAIERKYGER
jgi:hypothetical protein